METEGQFGFAEHGFPLMRVEIEKRWIIYIILHSSSPLSYVLSILAIRLFSGRRVMRRCGLWSRDMTCWIAWEKNNQCIMIESQTESLKLTMTLWIRRLAWTRINSIQEMLGRRNRCTILGMVSCKNIIRNIHLERSQLLNWWYTGKNFSTSSVTGAFLLPRPRGRPRWGRCSGAFLLLVLPCGRPWWGCDSCSFK